MRDLVRGILSVLSFEESGSRFERDFLRLTMMMVLLIVIIGAGITVYRISVATAMLDL